MTPMDQMSSAGCTSMDLLPDSNACTTSGAAYFSEKLKGAVDPADVRQCDGIAGPMTLHLAGTLRYHYLKHPRNFLVRIGRQMTGTQCCMHVLVSRAFG